MADPLGGPITSPLEGKGEYGTVTTGFPALVSNLITLAVAIGGLVALINIIIAAYSFIVASGDPQKITAAWNRIWQSLIGIVVLVAAVTIIGVIEQILHIDILQPIISGPGKP